jgi:hypothetical protein
MFLFFLAGFFDTRQALFSHYFAWVLFSVKGVGSRWQAFGLGQQLFNSVKLCASPIISDALKTNTCLFNQVRNMIFNQTGPTKHTALDLKCGLHKLALTRKVTAMYFDGFWSSLVRWAHLFESSTYRQDFSFTMKMLVQDSFRFMQVQVLPVELQQWQDAKMKLLGLFNLHDNVKKTKRVRLLTRLLTLDNSDPHSPLFIHWCDGCHSCGQAVLDEMWEIYEKLFADGFVAPLLYRWKHAAESLDFINETHLANIALVFGYVLDRVS